VDKEFLQYIKETGYDDLLDFNEKTIVKYKNTLHYQLWQLGKAYKELGEAIAKVMRETKLGSAMISLAKFLDKCLKKIF